MKRQHYLPLILSLSAAWGAHAEEKVLAEVQVTASGGEVTERREAATQKVIIGSKDIENMGALTVSDVMSKLPGVDAGAPGADGSMAMKARGMTRDSVQMYIDGERVAGNARMAQAMVGRLPSTELERVEIIRGASAEFGGSAPLTVNLVFKKARSKESTALKAAIGLRNDEPNTQFSFTKGGGDNGFSWMLPLTINHHDMPSGREVERRDGTGTNQVDKESGRTRINEFVFSPRLSWKSGSDSLTVAPSLFRAYGHLINDMTRRDLAAPANGGARHDDETNRTAFNRLRVDGEILRDGTKYSGRLAWSDGERKADMKRDFQGFGGLPTRSVEERKRTESDLNASLRADRPFGQHLLAMAVEEAEHQRDDSLHGTTGNESHSGWDRQWTAWVQDEWSPNTATTVTGGLRGESIRYSADGQGRQYNELLPSLALRWEPVQRWVFRTSLGAGIKAPKLEELLNQPVFSVSSNTPLEPDRRGNPNLKAERSVNFEAVLEHYLPGEAGVIGLNVYARQTEDFIERRTQQEGARWVERPWNEGTARHWGVELDGKLRADSLGWRGATFRAHLTVPRSEVDDQRLGITRSARETPRYQLSAGYDQTLGELSFGTSVQYFSRVVTEIASEQRSVTRDRTMLDAYVVQRLSPKFNLRLSLQNLLQTRTRQQQEASFAGSNWALNSTGLGVRTVMLALEGKW
ncbi:MAG: TonB-dependent receptor [Proteobacteria bacterium]|nr:TonB-dependent receptor [Pseudomonadota bacterium]